MQCRVVVVCKYSIIIIVVVIIYLLLSYIVCMYIVLCVLLLLCVHVSVGLAPYLWVSVPLSVCLRGDECVIPSRFSTIEKLFLLKGGGISGEKFF